MKKKSLTDCVKEALASMTEEEKAAMYAAQRSAFVKSMTRGCEHGALDFETCPLCRKGKA